MDGFHPTAGGPRQAVPNDTGRAGDSHPTMSQRVVTATCLSLLILCTLLGNSLVCAAVLRFRHLRSKVTNLFVVSLAVSDLLVAVLVMPWRAATDVLGFWPFGAFCDLWVAFDIMCCTASILNLCLISVERYCAIAGPFRHHGRVTPRVASVAIGVAWLLSLLISFIPVQLRWHKDVARGLNGSVEEGGCDSSLGRTYAISSSLVSFYIPVAIMLGTYGRLFRIARCQLRAVSSAERPPGHPGGDSPRETSPKNSFRKETKVLQTLSIIMGVFVCCWLPFFVLNCLVPFCHPEPREPGALPCVGGTVLSTFTWLGWANSALNPIIYAFNAEFRRAFASLLGWGCLCPGGAVQTVTFSNELVSFQPDTAERGAVETLSRPQPLTHAGVAETLSPLQPLPHAAIVETLSCPQPLTHAAIVETLSHPQPLPHAGAVETLSHPQPLPHAGAVETLSHLQPLPQAVLQLETHQGSSAGVSPGSSPPPQPFPECGTPVSLGKVPRLGSSAFH